MQVTSAGPCIIHGVACWFDVLFAGSQMPLWLSTAPGLPTTHW
jgi:histone-arginine methyltransferase CARM1